MSFKIITITGGDGTGKSTQSMLLSHVLQPSKLLAFPDNEHWSGRIIRAILSNKRFHIQTDSGIEFGNYTSTHFEEKIAVPFQYLQAINRLSWKERIREGLKSHHWICARYDVDAIAYGCAEGCNLDLTLKIIEQDIPSDYVIFLDGRGFRTVGEDINDRDPVLQQRVRDIFQAQAKLWPEKFIMVNVDECDSSMSREESIHNVHHRIGIKLGNRLGESLKPLTRNRVCEILEATGGKTG